MGEPNERVTKQVIVVRKDLKMPKGKIGSQTGHAAHLALAASPGTRLVHDERGRTELRIPLDDSAYAWLSGEYKKVCLSVDSEEQLLALHQAALAAGLRCALVQDNGHTVFNGVKTFTALAIGPHFDEEIDPLTRGLPLL